MLLWDYLRARIDRRARRRTDLAALEQLEGRIAMSYSSLGYSLPSLHVSGLAGSSTVWGGSVRLSITVQNTGASTINEPLALVPSTQISVGPDGVEVPPYSIPSTADSTNAKIGVYLTRSPKSLAGAVKVGTITAPALPQNDIEMFDSSVTLPSRPRGFPGPGGKVYLRLVLDSGYSINQANVGGRVSPAIPVTIGRRAQNLPSLRATAMDLPGFLKPGDTVAPTVQVTNLGLGNAPAGVQVALVASTTPDFNLGSSIVSTITIPSVILGLSGTPVPAGVHLHNKARALQNRTPGLNVYQFTFPNATLPTSPSTYYLGIVIDPNNRIKQANPPANRLELIKTVGPGTAGLPPAGAISTVGTNLFPTPPGGSTVGLS